jgi:hypothetical protein
MLAHSVPHISRIMSITHADFLRTLAQAVSGCDYRVQGNEIFVSWTVMRECIFNWARNTTAESSLP